MATKKTQVEKIETALRKYAVSPGVTAKAIAQRTKVPLANVYKRICDLRQTYTIYTNYRKLNGKRTAFYRLAD